MSGKFHGMICPTTPTGWRRVSDFVVNSKGFFAVADVLGSRGTGEAGGNMGTIGGVPEPSTWAMLLIGFAGLGFAGYRKAKTARTAFSVA